jgi:hypothetical protein
MCISTHLHTHQYDVTWSDAGFNLAAETKTCKSPVGSTWYGVALYHIKAYAQSETLLRSGNPEILVDFIIRVGPHIDQAWSARAQFGKALNELQGRVNMTRDKLAIQGLKQLRKEGWTM